jgi:tetratricopeptide (TPR) repeat protein
MKKNDGGDSFLRVKRRQEYHVTAARLEVEREAAALKVEPLLRGTPLAEWPALAAHPDLRTFGAMERLGAIIADAHTRDPKYALAVAELGVAIAESFPEDIYPQILDAQLRTHAWKDLGKSLRLLGRYEEALQALHKAEETIRQVPFLAYDLAVVQVNIAVVLQETNHYDASLALLKESKETFDGYSDTNSVVQCALLEGLLLQRLHRTREAREAYLLLLASSRNTTRENLAALHHAIGMSSIDLGDFGDAEANLSHAIALHHELGQPINALKSELGRGKLLLLRGDLDRAVSHLRTVRRGFLQNALAEEAGLCGLLIVEALLVLERAGQAEQLARKIVHEFTTARLSARAITALSYLAEAIIARKATAPMVQEVHQYILSLRTEPEREFTMGQGSA